MTHIIYNKTTSSPEKHMGYSLHNKGRAQTSLHVKHGCIMYTSQAN